MKTKKTVWSKTALGLSAMLAVAGGAQTARAARSASNAGNGIVLTSDAKGTGTPLIHFWSDVVGAGRANEGLRATWQEELQTAAKYDGFKYVRMHGIFHDDMFVYREDKTGKPIYNFQYIDDLYDRMLKTGVRPFVELSFAPSEMATAKNTTFWWKANGGPPSDYNKWAELVRQFVEHCVDRYGIDEVRHWYFEVWNEPNLTDSFFRGTQQQYFDLYKITVETVRKVDPQLKVGGPATSNFNMNHEALKKAQATGKPFDPMSIPWSPIWIEDFTRYCSDNHLPVDFISTHPYPQDFAIDEPGETTRSHFRRSIDSTRDDLRTIRKIVDDSPYPKAEIHLTEWNSSPSPVDHTHDSLPAAAFVVKTNLESIGLVDSLSYWTFTDVFEENRATDSIFHGGFGLINYQEIVKPAFHGYRLMNELGDEKLAAIPGAIITRDHLSGHIIAVAYNYPPEVNISLPVTQSLEAADKIADTGSARELDLTIANLPPHAVFLIETLDKSHGNATATWEQMGRPDPPNREQTELLRKLAWATQKETVQADDSGKLVLHRPLSAWAVVLIKQM